MLILVCHWTDGNDLIIMRMSVSIPIPTPIPTSTSTLLSIYREWATPSIQKAQNYKMGKLHSKTIYTHVHTLSNPPSPPRIILSSVILTQTCQSRNSVPISDFPMGSHGFWYLWKAVTWTIEWSKILKMLEIDRWSLMREVVKPDCKRLVFRCWYRVDNTIHLWWVLCMPRYLALRALHAL